MISLKFRLQSIAILTGDSALSFNKALRRWVMWLVWAWCLGWSDVSAEPYIPHDDNEVLVQLSGDSPNMFAQLYLLNNSEATTQELVSLARRMIELSRRQWDPRYLGYAQSSLEKILGRQPHHTAALLLRADLYQYQHHFQRARADLEQVLRQSPRNLQAWFTLAAMQTATGQLSDAAGSCQRLLWLGDVSIGAVCSALVASMTGNADKSYRVVERVLDSQLTLEDSVRHWAIAIQAEIALRLGQIHDAEQLLEAALAVDHPDQSTAMAYADVLMGQGRHSEALIFLNGLPPTDAVLVRIAESELLQNGRPGDAVMTMLRQRFDSASLRGGQGHLREWTRYISRVLKQPRPALELAQRNWKVQREFEDLQLLLTCALKARDLDVLNEAMRWIDQTGLQDQRLQAGVRRARELLDRV